MMFRTRRIDFQVRNEPKTRLPCKVPTISMYEQIVQGNSGSMIFSPSISANYFLLLRRSSTQVPVTGAMQHIVICYQGGPGHNFLFRLP